MNISIPRVVAVIGCGKASRGKEGWAIGHAHAHAYKSSEPGLRLLGVDPNAENLAAFGERFGVPPEDLFSSTENLYASVLPDVVSICTWPKLHAPQVIEAASRGVRGILCEKPMALNGLEIDAMLTACKNAGSHLAIAHQRCHDPQFRLAKKLLYQNAIGLDWVLEARVGGGWDILSWSVHWIDLANWLFESTPTSVMAGLSHSGQRLYQHAVEDASVVFAEYPEKKQAIFITGPDHYQNGETVFLRGSHGMIAIGQDVRVWNQVDGYRVITASQDEPSGMHAMVLEMFAAIDSGAVMQLDATRTALSTRTAFAAHESARLMRKVEAPFATGYAPLEILQHHPQPWIPEGRIVLWADEHFGSGGREGIVGAIESRAGQQPVVVDAMQGLSASDLAGAGVLLVYHTQEKLNAETERVMTEWVESGKPTVLIHAALGGFKNWEAYSRWAGMVWLWGQSEHPYQEAKLVATSPRFAAWKESWLPNDEVFIKLGETNPVDVLVEAIIPQGRFPAAWASKTHPNVTTWVPGHRREMWSVPAMVLGLFEMIRISSQP